MRLSSSFTGKLRGIYAIVDDGASRAPLVLLDALLAGGVRLVQYRAKAGVDRALVRAMHARTSARGALLVVNDDVAAALDADGLHAGQEDVAALDPAEVRARLGHRLFGVSCGSANDARRAFRFGADYLGAGPFAPTNSKPDAGDAIGEAGVRAIAAATPLPVAAIGGIDAVALPAVVRSGARMAAIIGALAGAADARVAAAELVSRWDELTT